MTDLREVREEERKFRVPSHFSLPNFSSLDPALRVDAQPELDLNAHYFDTDDLALIRWGITLRRREGGVDDGWHAKIPVPGSDGSVRDELRLALSDRIPPSLIDVLSPLLMQRELAERAVVRTHRAPFVLSDTSGSLTDGEALVEIVDDLVRVSTPEGREESFREIEVELISDSDRARDVAAVVHDALLAAGAQPSSVSKAADALGPGVSAPPDVPAFIVPADPIALDLLRASLSRHVRALLIADVGVRRNLPDAVHKMRVAARRIRSILGVHRTMVDAEVGAALRMELQWLASELGGVRDTEVQAERLLTLASELDEPDRTLVTDYLTQWRDRRMQAGRSGAMAALRSDRHDYLIDDLVAFVHDIPATQEAFTSGSETAVADIRSTFAALTKRVKKVDLDSPDDEWHKVRIAAKKARYAVESVVDALDKKHQKAFVRLAEKLELTTELLGSMQDSHVARTTLRELAQSPNTSPEISFLLGALHEWEWGETLELRAQFHDLWPEVKAAAKKASVS